MTLDDIHIHDSVILGVIEDTETDVLTFELSYPTDWDNDVYERRNLKFIDVLNYRVCEGSFIGSPTMLSYSVEALDSGHTRVKLETNAGYRKLSFKEVKLCPAT